MRTTFPCLLVGLLASAGIAVAASGAATVGDAQQELAGRVERAALEIARAQVDPPDHFDASSVRFGGASRTAAESGIELVLAEVDGPNVSGIVRLRFRLVVGGVPAGEALATVRGRVRGPALRAVRTLAGGEVVLADGVELVECDLTRLSGAPLRSLAELDDRVPLRTLGTGRVLASSLLEPAPRVRRGDVVEVTYANERFSIVASAVALSDGAVGELVRLENHSSGAIVRGRVQDDGRVTVDRGREAP